MLIVSPSYAMDNLADEDLAEVSGQAGADLSVKFTINHDANANFVCTDLVYCRLGMSLSNRYDDGSLDTYDINGNRTPSTTGRKQWLVFKGIQGTINIQELKFDGEDVVYGSTTKASLKLGFTSTKPIELRNVGFNSLSIETDTVANEGIGNVPGYLTPATLYGGTGFDANKEKGFLGLSINTNLSLTGSVKMFSCSSDNNHPRC
ncbi:MAG: hypothetical protein U1E99_08195 [Agitococcus sp.]